MYICIMDKKTIIQIIVKVAIYALGLIAAALGVSAMCSCTITRSSQSQGRAIIVTNDTTIIEHGGLVKFTKQ